MPESATPEPQAAVIERRAATPVAGGVAGVLFALLFSVSIALMITTMSEITQDTGQWLETGAGQFKLALGLLPFAGLFFLWFIAVARERLGAHEDQFFSTVFLGSGILFLAMMFSAAASAGALVATYARASESFVGSDSFLYARYSIAQVFNVYALRMAAVFVISQATLWLRTGVMPKWLAVVSYAVAILLLFVVTQSLWVVMVFPAWVFLVSAYILVTHASRSPRS